MRLRTYVIDRLIWVVPVFFLVSLLIFVLIHTAPSDPLIPMIRRDMKLPPEVIEYIRKWGFDKPLLTQYLIWMSRFFQGDLGFSFVRWRPVSDMIAQRVPYTLELVLIVGVVSLTISIVLGVVSAVKKDSLAGSLSSLGAQIVYSAPNFWIALMTILIFSVWMRLSFSGLILPVSVLALSWTAYHFRMVKPSVLGVLEQDYITTARAKGLSERVVIYKHALSNALLPLLKYEGYSIGFLLTSVAVIEWIFELTGLGFLFLESLVLRDYFVLWGSSLIILLVVLLVNAFADIAYAVLDPRIRRAPN